LVELLTAMAIIAILAGLILAAFNGVMNSASRKRAASEIQAMSTALESYKTDNGTYPVGNTTPAAGSSLLGPPSPGTYPGNPTSGAYQTAAEALYQALSGQSSYTTAPNGTTKSYLNFKPNEIGNPTGVTYVKDPWNYPYGYSTGDANALATPPTAQANYPNNGSGMFDLWSTGGTTGTKATDPNTWITNWQ
jgi:type II secretory pathway pseudopilin PulG